MKLILTYTLLPSQGFYVSPLPGKGAQGLCGDPRGGSLARDLCSEENTQARGCSLPPFCSRCF